MTVHRRKRLPHLTATYHTAAGMRRAATAWCIESKSVSKLGGYRYRASRNARRRQVDTYWPGGSSEGQIANGQGYLEAGIGA